MISFEEILKRMMDRVPNDIDNREGSMIYDALAPAAVELQLMYIELENIIKESFATTASRENLIKRAMERGLKPYKASKAVVKAVITPSTVSLNIGDRFSLETINYSVIDRIDDAKYKLECETSGRIGNNSSGQLIPLNYIDGLESIKIIELLIPGEDEEGTEEFRKRYFDSFESQAFGGNIKDYKDKTKGISGVGGVKVSPIWNGAGTVKLTILTSDYTVPSTELISQVKETIDPTANTGKGYGLAPIGHVVTVEGVKEKIVNITSTINYQSGWNFESSRPYIERAIDDYLKELSKIWEDQDEIIVRVSQIETRLLNAQGVLDIQNTRLNGENSNLTLGKMEIPKRGTING